ncbi:MAG: lipoate--protein ligase family protein [Verrucomicrobia bacterium]|nr:lipoate--protein ligase family protein [Verrucomicrobiota bacterium]
MTFRLLRLHSCPIYEQLLLEEALLRSSSDNWCIVNTGSTPAIVMGISGKKEELVDCGKAALAGIPLIKRFSGGGTVIVDENTLFITFISQKQMHDFPAYPEPIMKWTEEIYRDVFKHPDFRLRENDYVFGDRKFGGNAQYIKKDRWLHHTSFLWDYSPEKMQYLLHPKKTPPYRAGRSHEEFLCKLCELFDDRQHLIDRFIEEIEKRFPLERTSLEEALLLNNEDARRSTSFIPLHTFTLDGSTSH